MGSRILLADDSITIQKVVNLTFADEGIDVVAVSSGDLAERRLGEIKPDLVLADIFMPGKNGYELCESIKENAEFRNVPVVLLVGAFEPFDQAEARRVRADAHLTKPFESRTLVETVRRLINTGPATSTGPIAPTPMPEEQREPNRDAGPTLRVASLPVKIDLAAMTLEAKPADSSPPVVTTGELASPVHEFASELFDVTLVDTPAEEPQVATPSGVEDSAPIELSTEAAEPSDATRPSLFGLGPEDMILDFGKPDEPEPESMVDADFPETDDGDVLDAEPARPVEVSPWFDSVRETTSLDTPSTSNWHPVASTAPLSQPLRSSGSLAGSESSSEAACATLLAVDEPLGDVLLEAGISEDHGENADILSADVVANVDILSGDAFASADILSADNVASADTVSAEAASNTDVLSDDSLDVDLIEQRLVETPGAATEFDLVDSVTRSQGETSFAVEAEVASPRAGDVEHARSNGDAGLASNVFDDVDVGAERGPGTLDWTSPRAGVYSTSQLDSVVMPINPAEYAAEDASSLDALSPENAPEASFATGRMWTEEETRFAAIDIEAAPIDEPQAYLDQPSNETGFAFSPSVSEPPAPAAQPQQTAEASKAAASQPSEMGQAAIEEIVRRVVAEMSDSVVREIAWEVVPDCVERVIAQLAREGLSKQS